MAAACGDVLEDLEGRYLQALQAERAYAQAAIARSSLTHIVRNIVDLSTNIQQGTVEIHNIGHVNSPSPIVISDDELDTPGNNVYYGLA